jgi:hypothetical protein
MRCSMDNDTQFPINTGGRSGALRALEEAQAVCFVRLSIPTEVAFERLVFSYGLTRNFPLRCEFMYMLKV